MSKFLQALATGFGNPSMNRVMEKGFKRSGIMEELGLGGFNQSAEPEERVLPDGTRETVGSEGILVNGTNRQPMPQEDPEYDPYYGNRRDLEARDVAMQEIEEYRKENPRKGMFGVKGTLRDVLGFLGDTYLVGQGKGPAYQARRDQERMSDAQAGITNNPRAAAERAGYYDPEAGRTIMEKAEEAELRKAQQQSVADNRLNMQETRDYTRLKDARGLTQRVLAQPGAFLPDGNLSPGALSLLQTAATNAGTTVEALVGGDMSPSTLKLLGEADMSVNQQRNLPIAQQRADASTSQARSSAIRAARPPQGRQPRAETSDERYTRISNTPAGQRSAGDQDWYSTERNKRVKQGTPSSKGGRSLNSNPLGGGGTQPARRTIRPVGQ